MTLTASTGKGTGGVCTPAGCGREASQSRRRGSGVGRQVLGCGLCTSIPSSVGFPQERGPPSAVSIAAPVATESLPPAVAAFAVSPQSTHPSDRGVSRSFGRAASFPREGLHLRVECGGPARVPGRLASLTRSLGSPRAQGLDLICRIDVQHGT